MSVEQNHWSVYRQMLGGWQARVPLRADAPDALLEWVVEVIDAGYRTEVARFRKEDGTYWPRDELVEWLERGLAERQVVDAFAFARRFDRVGSKIAYIDERGITDGLVDDVGGLLRRLRGPEVGEQTYARRTCAPLWSVDVTAQRWRWNKAKRPMSAGKRAIQRLVDFFKQPIE